MEKYWEESGYKDEEKRYDLDRSSTGNFADQFGSDQDDTKRRKRSDQIAGKRSHNTIRITVDGKEFGTYSLSQDQIIHIGDTNVCEIKDGKVTMKKADCKDQICADHKAIEKSGETIVCLPHKVVIEIRSEDGKEQELDGVTQ